jgi:hypothetical protein
MTKHSKASSVTKASSLATAGLLTLVLVFLFWRSFVPGYVLFSNDGPLGQQMAAWVQLPGTITGTWADLNSIGSNGGAAPPTPNVLIRWILGPLGLANFLAPIALLTLGLGAWTFFRQLRFTPLAATLGALAAMLNSTFFSGACWGVATQEIGIGMIFFALALVASSSPARPLWNRWARIALAGFAVGINVMESADIGALFSLLAAAYVVYHTVVATGGNTASRLARGAARVIVIAVCAAFLAAYALTGLIGTQIKGIVGMQQDPETKAQRWNEATHWSLHKRETLGLIVPGLFGYRMDTPDGGNYWGAMGRDPAWEQYFESGKQGPPPMGALRFSGGGNYAGVLVVLVAVWAGFQSFRRKDSVFGPVERQLLWFWVAALVISLLLAFGRFAPFYRLIYALPYFSTMRNPAKFLAIFSFVSVVVFAYGIHGLSRRCLEIPLTNVSSFGVRLKGWWAKAGAFEKRWVVGCVAAVGASLLGWVIYSSSRHSLEQYLEAVELGGSLATQIASFSIRQVGWFVLLLATSVAVLTLVHSGALAGRRAKAAGILLGLILVTDLARANLPWIVYWNYPQKYETAGPNPIVQFLATKPHEHRVMFFPDRVFAAFQVPQDIAAAESRLSGLYGIEWNQQLFPYYNVQTLDLIQRPRTPEDIDAYERALAIRSADTLPRLTRQWELTNTRYILGYVGLLDLLNTQFDPGRGRFRIADRFDIVPRPGVTRVTRWEDCTAVRSVEGAYAVFDFTGALPRAKLYTNWQKAVDDPAAVEALGRSVSGTNLPALLQRFGTNDFLTLEKLASREFDPAQTVLLATPVPAPTNSPAAGGAGTVEFTSYAPKRIQLRARPAAPSILLLNDKYDPYWQVWVDGKRAELLRCNFIMRGVYLEPGDRTVEFLFKPPIGALYVSLAAVLVGLCLLGGVAFSREPHSAREPSPASSSTKEPRRPG